MLATMVVGKAPSRWEDSVVFEFEKQLQDMVNRIENQALEAVNSESSEYEGLGVEPLLERRINSLVARLEQAVGEEKARTIVLANLDQRAAEKDETSGNTARSTG